MDPEIFTPLSFVALGFLALVLYYGIRLVAGLVDDQIQYRRDRRRMEEERKYVRGMVSISLRK